MPLRTEALLGPAGTGKTTLLRQRLEDDPKYARLTATTGIAAVNLGAGVTTVHSALGFYDTRSAAFEYDAGRMTGKFIQMAKAGIKMLVIDELSMLSAQLLDIIYAAAEDAYKMAEAGAYRVHYIDDEGKGHWRESNGDDATGLLLTGDFCQLPPISTPSEPAEYAFKAKCWPLFEANMEKLTTVYRQTNPAMLEALRKVRAGRAVDAAIDLKKAGVKFVLTEDADFDGLTLFPTNKQLEGFNERRLAKLPGAAFSFESKRWGKQAPEWKNIPEALELKEGALIMCLSNQPVNYEYVNGDIGTVVRLETALKYDADLGQFVPCDSGDPLRSVGQGVTIATRRNYTGGIGYITRHLMSYDPKEITTAEKAMQENESAVYKELYETLDFRSPAWLQVYDEYVVKMSARQLPYLDPKVDGVVIGAVSYMPLRLAYGSSFHKTQGLTLDNVQIMIGNQWAAQPSMMYVALSRCREATGIRIVGDVARLSRRVTTARDVLRWV